jgi:hypothetical protein
VAPHARDGRRSRLVDVYARDRPPILGSVVGDFRAPAADSCANTTRRIRLLIVRACLGGQKLTVVEKDDAAGACELLEQLNALGVILALNLFVVLERGVLSGVMEELEAVLVEGRVVASAEVLDFDGVRLVFPIGGALAGYRIDVDVRPCFGPVGGWGEVSEGGIDEVRLARNCHVGVCVKCGSAVMCMDGNSVRLIYTPARSREIAQLAF